MTVEPDSTEGKIWKWFWNSLIADNLPPKLIVRHIGRCGRCGKALDPNAGEHETGFHITCPKEQTPQPIGLEDDDPDDPTF